MYRDLMAAYRQVVDKYDCHDMSEAFHRAVNSPAPRFYVHPRRAARIIYPMFQGDFRQLQGLKPLKREMYEELFRIVLRMSGQWKYHGKSVGYILSFAILEPAPRFYVSPSMMYKIYNNRREYDRRFARVYAAAAAAHG